MVYPLEIQQMVDQVEALVVAVMVLAVVEWVVAV
jgi:hypothetical protein